MAEQVVKELWKNEAAGMRWVTVFDPVGNPKSQIVHPGKTFLVSPLERQVNQDAVHAKGADLFTNGTFTLVRATEETVADEIESVNSLSDDEIEAAIAKVKQGDTSALDLMIEVTYSHITASRIYEALVVADVAQSWVSMAKTKMDSLEETLTDDQGNPIVSERVRTGVGTNVSHDEKDKWKVAVT